MTCSDWLIYELESKTSHTFIVSTNLKFLTNLENHHSEFMRETDVKTKLISTNCKTTILSHLSVNYVQDKVNKD